MKVVRRSIGSLEKTERSTLLFQRSKSILVKGLCEWNPAQNGISRDKRCILILQEWLDTS